MSTSDHDNSLPPRPMQLITQAQREQLIANGRASRDADTDHRPVVKLFTPDAGATWLLTELDPDQPDLAWGLCDLGLGFAEYGTVLISEIASFRGRLNLPVERDLHFQAKGPISAYIAASGPTGRIVESLPNNEGGAK